MTVGEERRGGGWETGDGRDVREEGGDCGYGKGEWRECGW